ncbi:MAG: hypothetical protein NC204_01115 [Candidatus Amulumruptor caecigallinarius]|nr:hypothetical protein [Candidatus Amulumruptor caecigallinarius]
MKKLILSFMAAAMAFCASAATVQYYVKGEPVANGTRVDLTPYWNETAMQWQPHLTMIPSITGTCTVTCDFFKNNTPPRDNDWVKGADMSVQFCSLDDQCQSVLPNQQISKTGFVTKEEGKAVDMQIELAIELGDEETMDTLALIDSEFSINTVLGGEENIIYFYVNKSQGGVDGIIDDADNAVKEYYDLQGRRVQNPEKGIYIVRQGGKVSKIVK